REGDLLEAHEKNVCRAAREDYRSLHRRHGREEQRSFRPSGTSRRMFPDFEVIPDVSEPQEIHVPGVLRPVPGAHHEQKGH
ncbi:hypothetical protein PanWU01x14_008540, partial [Parasponia andersonii]